MRKKNNIVKILLVLLLSISVGYALLSTTLKINGSANITKNTWSVYWANPVVTEGSVTTTPPTIGNDTNGAVNTVATWNVNLSLPGDFYEFTVDAVNAGSIDAMITNIEKTAAPALPAYIKYDVTYADGVQIKNKHMLAKKEGNENTVEKYKVRVEFLDIITPTQMNQIPENGVTYTFTYAITYSQADNNAYYAGECPGVRCVYAFYTDEKNFGRFDASGNKRVPDTLTDYTRDYTTITKNNVQREGFLGHILDSHNRIVRGFGCGFANNNLYCVEGYPYSSEKSTELLDTNMRTLQSFEYWNNGCYCQISSETNQQQCECTFDSSGIEGTEVDLYEDGSIFIRSNPDCYVQYGGMFCETDN